MGPAPAVAQVRSAVRDALQEVLRSGRHTVLIACSGGADSLALAAATAFEAERLQLRAGLITVDHGLRDGSAEQATAVTVTGRRLGLDPVLLTRVRVGRAGGPEAAARAARYTALDDAAQDLDACILLGHTLDDQAETVLLGLGRGSGPRSIAGMAAVDGRYLRPLLGLRRSTTLQACAALGLTPWADPDNVDPAHQRVRLRLQALPLLEDVLQGGVAEALARTADLLRDDVAALDAWAEAALAAASSPAALAAASSPAASSRAASSPAAPSGLVAGELVGLPRAVRTRVLRAWATAVGAAPLSAERTAALEGLVMNWHGQGPVDLPGGVAVGRTSGTLVALPAAQPAAARIGAAPTAADPPPQE